MKKMIAVSLIVTMMLALSACSTVNFEKVRDEVYGEANANLVEKAKELGIDIETLAKEAESLAVDPLIDKYNESNFIEWFFPYIVKIVNVDKDKFTEDLEALNDYYYDISLSITVSSKGKSMTIEDYKTSYISDVNDRLGLPQSLTSKIEMTGEGDGQQTETLNGITVTWSFKMGEYDKIDSDDLWTVVYEK